MLNLYTADLSSYVISGNVNPIWYSAGGYGGIGDGSVNGQVLVPTTNCGEERMVVHIDPANPNYSFTMYPCNSRWSPDGVSYYPNGYQLTIGSNYGLNTVNAEWTNYSSQQFNSIGNSTIPALHDGSVVRAVVRNDPANPSYNYYYVYLYVDNVLAWSYHDTSGSGAAGSGSGFGAVGMSGGTLLSELDLGPLDTIAPNAISASSIGIAAYTNHVDLQWPAGSDDPNGIGVYGYQIFRNGQLLTTTTGLSYSDSGVVPNSTYTYTLRVVDYHWNTTDTNFTVNTPHITTNGPVPSATPDGMRIGVHPTGAYWGAGSENIDVLSGNVSFSIPLFKAMSRGGGGTGFSLSYNSQNWRQDSGGTWQFNGDVGYGFGWKLLAGSIMPVWNGASASLYVFTDATGAEYRLDQNNGNVWSSKESIYVYFDANTNTLHFRDGRYWIMGCTSASSEADAGTMYPTVMEDTNGNQILIRYNTGAGASWTNSSARIHAIEDVRALSASNDSGNNDTYLFAYNTDAVPHLTSITNTISTGENYMFAYQANQALSSPINGISLGTTTFLQSSTISNLNMAHTFSYNGSGELTEAILPYGGYLKWTYDTVTYSGGTSYREVQNRILSKDGTSASETTYAFSHEPSITTLVHQYTVLDDPGGVGEKYWAFGTSGLPMGLVTQYQGRQRPGPVAKTQNDFTWAQDAIGNSYISATLTTLDPGQSYQAQSETTQSVDIYGNVTQVNAYNYGNLSAPYRTNNYSYLNTSAYTSRYIFNRLTQATVTDGTTTTTLVTNTYDSGALASVSGSPREWDSSYTTSVTARGNLTQSVQPGTTTATGYDATGNVTSTSINGVATSVSSSSNTNFAVPSQLSLGSLTTSLSWSSFLGLTNDTGPNGDSTSTYYDSYARKQSTTSPFGATTNYTYSSAPYSSSNPATVTAITNGHWTRTTLDGLGRTAKVETGDANGTKSVAETIYAPCGCSPLGKMTQQAMPHLPNASAVYTTYSYDGIGRTVSVLSADGASTTQYLYQGNTVKTTDAAGKWKIFTMDVLGNLAQVEEPNPAGGTDYFTYYTYDLWGNLKQVSMPRPSGTQTRSFTYNGKLLMSATNPENGTITYTYNSTNNKVATKTDAKGQQIVYSYDSLARLTKVQRYTTGAPYNLALNKPATESSAVYAPASLAVDGNTDGNFNDGSVSHTGLDANAWWQVDLGVSATVNSVVIWNRTDCCSDRLSDYWVFVSNTPFLASDTPATLAGRGGTYSSHQTSAPSPNTVINFSGVPGRYVRVQLSGTNYLALAEVQVMGTTSGTPVEDICQQENYAYDTNPFNSGYSQYSAGRLTAVQYYGGGPGCGTTFKEMYSYNTAGAKTNKGLIVTRTAYWQTSRDSNGNPSGSVYSGPVTADLESSYTYDNEGRMTAMQYPGSNDGNGNVTAGPNTGYGYDSMGRLYTATDLATSSPLISSATYGTSNELLSMSGQINESRTYNSMLQLVGLSNGSVNITYSYSATQNNGKIVSQTDNISGEQVVYAYDTLNRLASAQATSNSWGQSYGYDGFGNLTDQTVTAGTGTVPTMNVVYNASTNRQTGDCADANGNLNSASSCFGSGLYAYDVENRIAQGQWNSTYAVPSVAYSYAPGNKRVWRGVWDNTSGAQTVDEVTFWSVTGQKLGAYTVQTIPSTPFYSPSTPTVLAWNRATSNLYFGGKLIKNASGWVGTDRLGSIGKFYPYGQEKPSATTNGTEKFTGYFRDSETGLDYAMNRYHAPGQGRFMTPDPYQGSASANNPSSWNRYAYALGDPIKYKDPTGTHACDPEFNDGCTVDNCDPEVEDCTCSMDNFFGVGNDCWRGGGNEDPPPPPPQPSCGIDIASSGTPQNQNLVGLFRWAPTTNTLGTYTTIGQSGVSQANQGWFVAVQIRGSLGGDTNPADWTATQTYVETGSVTYGGRTSSGTGTATSDDPLALAIYKSTGTFDWLDAPGSPQYSAGATISSANLTDIYTSTLTDGGHGCSVTWSTKFTFQNGKASLVFSVIGQTSF